MFTIVANKSTREYRHGSEFYATYFDAPQAERATFEPERVALAESVDWLKSKREELAAENMRLVEAVDFLEGEKATLAESVDWLKSKREELAAKNVALTETIDRLEAEKAGLEGEKAGLEGEKAGLEAEKAGLEAEKAGLEAERQHLSQSFHRLEHEYVTAQSQRDYLQQEREVLYRSRLLRTLVRLRALRRIGPRRVLKKLLAKMQPASSLRLVIDYPLANSTVLVSKRVYVAGWTFSGGGPVDRVEVFVGETLLGCLACGVERPDVAAAFPEAVHAGGYGGVVALKGVPSGAHELVVRATDRAGKSESVRRFIVVGASSEGASGAPTTVLPEVRATASSRSR